MARSFTFALASIATSLCFSQSVFAVCMNPDSVNNPTNVTASNDQEARTVEISQNGGKIAGTITLAEFRERHNIPTPKISTNARPASEGVDYIEPCYDGVSVLFQTGNLERVVVEGQSIQYPETWADLVATYFIKPAPPLEPAIPNEPPAWKIERCKVRRATCEKVEDEAYKNAIASCEDIKPGPGINFLVAPVVANCRDQALNLYRKKLQSCDLGEQLCLRE